MRCKKCLLTDKFPKIKFNEEGICNYCLHEEKSKKLAITDAERLLNEIDEELNKVKGKNRYDALVLYSGGKDSTYTLKLAVEKYGLNVLAYTYDNGYLSEQARVNILNIVEELNCDHIFFKPKRKAFIELSKIVSSNEIYPAQNKTRISDICQACINTININAVELALEKDIPFIIAGFTSGQIPKNSVVYEFKYNTIKEFRKNQDEKILQLGGNELDKFLSLPKKFESYEYFPRYINLLTVQELSENDIIEECKKIGWVKPKDVDGSSSNCKLNSFSNLLFLYKYGFHPYEQELSTLIRKNLLTREEGLAKLNDFGKEEEIFRIGESLGYDSKFIKEIILITK